MTTIYQEYLEILSRIKEVNEEKAKEIAVLNTRKTAIIYAMFEENKAEYLSKDKGVINVNRGSFAIKINKKVDLVPRDLESIKEVAPSCFISKTTETFSKTNYNKLPVDVKERVDKFMDEVVKDPTFDVKDMEG